METLQGESFGYRIHSYTTYSGALIKKFKVDTAILRSLSQLIVIRILIFFTMLLQTSNHLLQENAPHCKITDNLRLKYMSWNIYIEHCDTRKQVMTSYYLILSNQ